ncbi:MAG: NapC/NirT family cytochrome c, partial [Actinomycetes bacterium]
PSDDDIVPGLHAFDDGGQQADSAVAGGSEAGSTSAGAGAGVAAGAAAGVAAAAVVAETKPPRKHFRRIVAASQWVYRQLSRIPHPPLNTVRGLLLLVVLVGLAGVALTMGGMKIVSYSESTAFCANTCHTMAPEKKAHEAGPHKEVECASCHVGPGLVNFVKVKMGGTKELFDLVTNRYPTPIHMEMGGLSALPPVEQTCMGCHPGEQLMKTDNPLQLIIGATYQPNTANTKQMFALAVRTNNRPRVTEKGESEGGGVHWHIDKDIQYIRAEQSPEKIDLVKEINADGTETTFIASQAIGDPKLVTPDLSKLEATGEWHKMDCYDCHNRVGHNTPMAPAKVNESINNGNISTDVPHIKSKGDELLGSAFSSYDAADAAFDLVSKEYVAQFPLLGTEGAPVFNRTMDTLKADYREVATPDMKVFSGTWPNNNGHQNTPGCFRCHDGVHYAVENGQATGKKIPNDCSTCHTFPQTGPTVTEMPLGKTPVDHVEPLWVFNHAKVAGSVNPAGTNCSACHGQSYCQNCHNTGAIKIQHTEMKFNHPQAIVKAGGTTSCQVCHVSSMCNTCHSPSRNVLGAA